MRGFRNGTKPVGVEIRPGVSVIQIAATFAPTCWISPKVVGYEHCLRARGHP